MGGYIGAGFYATGAGAMTTLPTLGLRDDFSLWAMVQGSDAVVKTVMVLLSLASITTWTVWIVKTIELRRARAALQADVRTLEKAAAIATLSDLRSEVARSMLAAIRGEMSRGTDLRHSAAAEGLKERVGLRLQILEIGWARRMLVGTNVVASIGATAPFVGLFGTVWGIMNSFVGIARAHSTNLPVVAPGIAEALLTTAIGLGVAVPAVLIYNALTRALAGYRALLAEATNTTACLVSVELEHLQRGI